MTFLRLCGIAVLGMATVLIVREYKPELTAVISVTTGLIILTSCVASLFPIVSFLKKEMETASFSLYYRTMLKSLGVGILTEITADAALECGAKTVAKGIEYAGKIGILLLSLPIAEELLSLAGEILK